MSRIGLSRRQRPTHPLAISKPCENVTPPRYVSGSSENEARYVCEQYHSQGLLVAKGLTMEEMMDTRFDVEIRRSNNLALPVQIWVRNTFGDVIARHGFETYTDARRWLNGTKYHVIYDEVES